MNADTLTVVLNKVRACRVCRDRPAYGGPLPHEPRPVLQLTDQPRLLLAGQAPGARVHASGQPFTDPSGDRLRRWLGLDESTFYDEAKLAIVPMGFCFPGYDARGSDLAPRRECRETWHNKIFATRPSFDLTLLIGRYARDYHLPEHARENLTQTIQRYAGDLDAVRTARALVLPHPSWRNTAWLKRHPWFEDAFVPRLQARVANLLAQA
ncbi:MAG: uracil-DNA glycosylase family protein [Pseudomonadota bacterium]